jgi:hypothetical protein
MGIWIIDSTGGRMMNTISRSVQYRITRRQFLKASGAAALGAAAAASGLGCAGCSGKKTVVATARDDYVIAYQELSRPKIEELLGVEAYERCCEAMLAEYESFTAYLPTFEDAKNEGQFYHSAPFMLALYRALRGEFANNQETALTLLGQITNYKVSRDWQENHGVEKFMYARLAKSAFLRDLGMKKFEAYQDEPYGWAVEAPESDAYLALDFTRCGLVDWFTDMGAPEISTTACAGDFIVAQYYTGLELVRTKTIADGDALCDFRYIKI